MKVAQLAQIGFIVLAALGVYAFVTAARDGHLRNSCSTLCAMRPNYAALNRTAPDFALPDLEGRTVRLSDYRGQVVILNFWTKTCRPCLEELPSLSELGQMLQKESGIVLVTITTDESAADARATLQSVLGDDVPFVTLVDSEHAVVREMYGTRLYPETWFIDTNGVIRARFDGPRDWSASIAVEFARSLSRPFVCEIAFQNREPVGEGAALCESIPAAG